MCSPAGWRASDCRRFGLFRQAGNRARPAAREKGKVLVNTVDEPYGELASSFAAIARTLFSVPTVLATLQQIVDFAFVTVEGCDVACISLRANDTVFTPAYSAPLALEVDQLQYAAREGPCLDAILKEPTVYAEDLAEDQRWPVFGPQAAALGMRSLLSCRLSTNGTRWSAQLVCGSSSCLRRNWA